MIFDAIYCLNQSSRPDRWEQAQDEFNRVGIDPIRFYSVLNKEPWKSFCISQKLLIETIIQKGHNITLCLEDDVIFKNYDKLQEYTNDLPNDWDILYLGANITDPNPVQAGKNILKIRSAWTTHAICYNRKVLDSINKYNPDVHGMYDDWLSREVLPNVNAYCVKPMIAWQRPGYSDLWGKEVDYTGAFQEQSKKIR